MQAPKLPDNEQERLRALYQLDVLDTEPEPSFERITALAKSLFDVPSVLISLIDSERQWFKSRVGFDATETDRKVSFCAYAVGDGKTLVVEDACTNDRFKDHPAVENHGVRFYAGALITIPPDLHLGTLCLFDSQPREFSAQQQDWLEALARIVADELQLRYELHNREAEQQLFAEGPVAVVIWDAHPDWQVIYAAKNIDDILGYSVEHVRRPEFNYLSCVYHDDRALVREALRQLSQGERDHWEIDYRILTRTGELRWVRQVCRADHNSKGEVIRIRGYLLEQTQRKQLEMLVQDSNERFALALDAGDLSTWDWDLGSGQIQYSDRWHQLLGLDQDNSSPFIRDWRERVHPSDSAVLERAMESHFNGDTSKVDVRFRLRHEAGHWVWMHSVGKLVERDATGKPKRLVGTHRDITEQVENEIERNRQQRILDLLSAIQNEFLLAKDFGKAGAHLLDVLLGVTGSEFGLVGEFPDASRQRELLWVHGVRQSSQAASDAEGMQELVQQGLEVTIQCETLQRVALRGETIIENEKLTTTEHALAPLLLPTFETMLAMPIVFNQEVVGLTLLANSEEGYRRQQLAMLKPVMDALGTMIYTRRVEQQRAEAQAELKRMATTDELTGVANRRTFLQQCRAQIDHFERYQQAVTLILIDLDHFKKVNDNFGHGAGDVVLQTFTERTLAQLREVDLLGRLGGEEFAVLLPHTSESEALVVADRIRKALAAAPVQVDTDAIVVTMSAGLAEYSQADTSPDKWIARADEALYEAKAAGRNTVVVAPQKR